MSTFDDRLTAMLRRRLDDYRNGRAGLVSIEVSEARVRRLLERMALARLRQRVADHNNDPDLLAELDRRRAAYLAGSGGTCTLEQLETELDQLDEREKP